MYFLCCVPTVVPDLLTEENVITLCQFALYQHLLSKKIFF